MKGHLDTLKGRRMTVQDLRSKNDRGCTSVTEHIKALIIKGNVPKPTDG